MRRLAFSILGGSAALLACAATPAAAREAEEIACPQTLVAPDAQARMDAGEQPTVVKSWYKPGLASTNGFCAVTLAPETNRLFLRYNEAASIAQIPVRFEYTAYGLNVYAGPAKGMPFGTGAPDMTCFAPEAGGSAVDCRIAVADKSGLTMRLTEGRGVTTNGIIAIDPQEMFGKPLKEQSRFVHFQMNYGFLDTAALMSMFTPVGNTYDPLPVDCTKDIWKDTVTEVKISTGLPKDNSLQVAYWVEIVGNDVSLLPLEADEIPPLVARFSASSAGGANALIGQIMSNEAVQVDVTTACEGAVSKTYLTEVGRLMGRLYQALKPGMLAQQ